MVSSADTIAPVFEKCAQLCLCHPGGDAVFQARNDVEDMGLACRRRGRRVTHGNKDPGFRHLALRADDFDTTYNRLRSSGVLFEGEPVDTKGVKIVFFADPDGNQLPLIHRETPLPRARAPREGIGDTLSISPIACPLLPSTLTGH
jgi:hypothetical protein